MLLSTILLIGQPYVYSHSLFGDGLGVDPWPIFGPRQLSQALFDPKKVGCLGFTGFLWTNYIYTRIPPSIYEYVYIYIYEKIVYIYNLYNSYGNILDVYIYFTINENRELRKGEVKETEGTALWYFLSHFIII